MAEYTEKAAPKTKPNYLYAIISIALVLFLLGFFGLMLLEANHLVASMKEKINVMVEIKDGVDKESIARLEQELEKRHFTKTGSVRFISKGEAAKLMREDFGEDFLKLDLPNPFYDVLSFNVRSNYMQADSLSNIRRNIMQHEIVSDVFYQESMVDEIAGNIDSLAYIALGAGLLLILGVTTLIHNTIRLALYSNRFIIKNMQLVGATWEFISRPYLIQSFWHGLISGLLAIFALILILWKVQSDLPELGVWQHWPGLAALFGALLLLGILISRLSTYYVVKKYLKMRVDDLY